MSVNAVFNPPLPPRPQQQQQQQQQQLQQQQQQQPQNNSRYEAPVVKIVPSSASLTSSGQEPRMFGIRTPSPTPSPTPSLPLPVQNTFSFQDSNSNNNSNTISNSNNNKSKDVSKDNVPWLPGTPISLSQQQLDGVQGLETTTPFRRSLDSQRSTPHGTRFNLDKPLPAQPQLRDMMPPALVVTSNYSRTFSGSAPPSASSNGPLYQDYQHLSSSFNNPSPLSHHRISTVSTNSPFSYNDDLYIPPSRQSLDQQSIHQLPPYSVTPGNHGSTLLVSPPTEEDLFRVEELTLASLIHSSNNPSSSSVTNSSTGNTTSSTVHNTTTSSSATTAGSTPCQYICADPMHDQQYLLVGSGNALHSIDLTLASEKQTVKTHIQGLAFKEIHCLEEIGLVVVIAGRNSRVRCYDYDSIMRLVGYGHSSEGHNRPVDGGKLAAVKNMIQLRVETAIQKDDQQQQQQQQQQQLGNNEHSKYSPLGSTSSNSRILKGTSPSTTTAFQQQPPLPPLQNRHQHTSSIDRTSLLSPPSRSDTPAGAFDSFKGNGENDSDSASIKKSKQRPTSFAGWASLAQEHVLRSKGQQQQSSSASTPTSPSSGNGSNTKNNRLSQMASYLTQAAANTNMTMQLSAGSDGPSSEAIQWATDFTKLKQTKDVLGLDFHYTVTTVYMTVLYKTGIDIYSRPKAVRGRKPAPASISTASGNGNSEDNKRSSMMSAGMVMSASRDSFSSIRENPSSYEWRLHKQFYHPEAPSFMTVVKDLQDVTDIILGKGPRACIINVETMSVDDLQRQGNSQGGVFQGLGKKLGFKNHPLWHSFEKIPFDVPPFILYPDAAAAIYNAQRDSKERYTSSATTSTSTVSSSFVPTTTSAITTATTAAATNTPNTAATATATSTVSSNLDHSYNGSNNSGYNEFYGSSDYARRSRDDIIQRPSDQHSIHQQQIEEQERAEAENVALKFQQTLMVKSCSSSPNSNPSSSTSSLTSPLPPQQPPQQPQSVNAPPYPQPQPHNHLNNGGIISSTNGNTSNNKSSKKTRMVTSDEVLHMAFCQRTTMQLFLATYGSQSRIVDIRGKAQSPIILEWESSPPQKVEFLKTDQDIYVIGFEKSCIIIFSLTRAKKIKEISKADLIRAADTAIAAAAAGSSSTASSTLNTTTDRNRNSFALSPAANITTNTATSSSSSSSSSSGSRGNRMSVYESTMSSVSSVASANSTIKFLGRDNFADSSLGIFFSYCHPKNGTAICKLSLLPIARDELELVGYYA